MQRGLIEGLAALVHSVVVGRDVGIERRVEELRVDAVRDTQEIRTAFTQESVQALPELGGQDLLRVPFAHGRDDVRRLYGARHQIRFALVFDRQAAARKTDKLEHLGARSSLVREVVDREDRRRPPQLACPRRERNEQGGMPIVGMHDVARRLDQILKDRAAEERVALRVIVVSVDLVARDAKVTDEYGPHSIADDLGVLDASASGAVRDRVRARAGCRDPELLSVDRAVIRHVHGDVVAEGRERLRQGTRDIGEAADLGVGGDLGGRERNPHVRRRMLAACKDPALTPPGCHALGNGCVRQVVASLSVTRKVGER